MEFIFFIILLIIIPFTILLILTRCFIKTFIFLSIILFIIASFISFIIIDDARSLTELEHSNSLFIYKEDNEFKKGIILNFSSTESKPLKETDLIKTQSNLKNNQKKVTNIYFKTFIFSKTAMETLIDEEIPLSSELSFTKQEILTGINSPYQEESDSFFLIAISNIFENIAKPQNLSTFVSLYKSGDVEIYPSIKALSFLSFLPETFLSTLVSKFPQPKKETI